MKYERVAIRRKKGDSDEEATLEAQEEVGEPRMPAEPAEPAPVIPSGPTTTDGPTAAELMDVVQLPLVSIMPDPLNPNEEAPGVFNMLVTTISEDGFNQPVVVCPVTDLERATWQAPPEVQYVLVKGEHRWRAARVLGHATIPAVIRQWDSLTRRSRLVRDNTVKGEINRDKFTELVHSLQAEHSLDSELASSLLGFDTSAEMFKLMTRDGNAAKKALDEKAVVDRTKDDLKVLDDLSLLLNSIFTKSGHQLQYGFIGFMFGGKLNYMVEMDDELSGLMTELAQICLDRKVQLPLLLAAVLREGMGPSARTRVHEIATAETPADAAETV